MEMYEIFEKLLKERNVTPYRVSKETGISTSTFTEWKKGSYTPKQDKLKKIADYFGVTVDYFLDGESETSLDDDVNKEEEYYLDDDTRKLAQELFENKELRLLLDATRKAKKEDLLLVYEMLKRMKSDD